MKLVFVLLVVAAAVGKPKESRTAFLKDRDILFRNSILIEIQILACIDTVPLTDEIQEDFDVNAIESQPKLRPRVKRSPRRQYNSTESDSYG
jgi:hypothetical protein